MQSNSESQPPSNGDQDPTGDKLSEWEFEELPYERGEPVLTGPKKRQPWYVVEYMRELMAQGHTPYSLAKWTGICDRVLHEWRNGEKRAKIRYRRARPRE